MPSVPVPLDDLRAFYRTGEDVEVAGLPAGTARARARNALGSVVEAELGHATARLSGLRPGTYSVEALGGDGSVLAEEITTVGAHAGERPVHGFATSFQDDDVPHVLEWLRALRCTVVQIYDWMARYTAPLGTGPVGSGPAGTGPVGSGLIGSGPAGTGPVGISPTGSGPPGSGGGWQDPSGRPVSFEALKALAAGIRAQGAVAHAYAPVYAVDLPFAATHPELLMYRNDGGPQSFFDFIQLADPSNKAWQRHFVDAYGRAADAIGFNGFHLDTYGYPRLATDRGGGDIDMRAAYESFLAYFRSQRPADLVSFNQVNGVPAALELAPGPRFRYCEVWPPNDSWRHLEGLLDRSAGVAGRVAPSSNGELVGGTIACYPPVWSGDDRQAALRTVVLTEAVATCLGASALLYGDRTAALCDPYYPKHERLSSEEAATILAWRRFALRCRDLFIEGEDTSWYEMQDENGAVAVDWSGDVRPGQERADLEWAQREGPEQGRLEQWRLEQWRLEQGRLEQGRLEQGRLEQGRLEQARPEPVGGAVFARVVHAEDRVAVGVVDLTGSGGGRWSEPTGAGRCRSVRVRVLVPAPERWRAAAAVLGRDGDRFVPVPFTVAEHRQGRAVEVEVPVQSGWSVLRLLGPGLVERNTARPNAGT